MALFLEIGSMIISALQIRFLYLSPTTITGNVTCTITIETQNIIIHRPEFVSSSVSGSFCGGLCCVLFHCAL